MASHSSLSPEDTLAAQAIYSPLVLALYDWWVLGISNRWIWRCPTPHLLAHFNRHITANHLDVGVGTGYFLDRAHFPSAMPRLALLDLNTDCLSMTAKRVARYKPVLYHANILEPLNLETEGFDSISLNYVLHCLPGNMETKSSVFLHLKTVLNPGGVIFGSTLLHDSRHNNWLAQTLMTAYNAKKIFSNKADELEGLQQSLHQHFSESTVEVRGCVALFSGQIS